MAEKDPEVNALETKDSGVNGEGSSDIQSLHFNKPTLANRIGTISAVLFFGSVVTILLAISFLAFLWFSNLNNTFWHKVMVEDVFKQCITLLSTVIRFGITIQVGLCLSMAAALALESHLVPHQNVPSVSIMRIGGAGIVGTLKDLIYPLLYQGRGLNSKVLSLTIITIGILFTSTLLQFTSTALLFDTSESEIPSNKVDIKLPIDYSWVDTNEEFTPRAYTYPERIGSKLTWEASIPQAFPIFAEYHAEPEVRFENTSDTGLTLRAFIPLTDQEQRRRLVQFEGKALVMDQRATCVQPLFEDILLIERDPNNIEGGNLYSGRVGPRIRYQHMRLPPKPQYFTVYDSSFNVGGINIHQLVNSAIIGDSGDKMNAFSDFSGSLYSELRESSANFSGSAYLIFNLVYENNLPGPEWVWLPTPPNLETPSEFGLNPGYHSSCVTLCYTALDTANRRVSASLKPENNLRIARMREPVWSAQDKNYQFDNVIEQVTVTNQTSINRQRNVLQLRSQEQDGKWEKAASNDNFNDGPAIQPARVVKRMIPFIPNGLHLRQFESDMSSERSESQWIGNSSVLLSKEPQDTYHSGYQLGQPWMVDLFHQMLSSHTAAHALQGLIHVLASNLYYNQLPFYDKVEEVSIYNATDHLLPLGWFGNPVGYPIFFILVCAILVLHHIFVAILFWKFSRECRLSRLGDAWQAIAQVALSSEVETKGALEKAATVTADRETAMNVARSQKLCMGIDFQSNGVVTLKPQKV